MKSYATKSIVYLFLILILITNHSFSITNKKTKAKEKVLITKDIYLGEFANDKIKRKKFIVSENILSHTEDCDCLTVAISQNRVLLQFDPAQYSGRVNRVIYLETKSSTYQINVIADVLEKN